MLKYEGDAVGMDLTEGNESMFNVYGLFRYEKQNKKKQDDDEFF